MLPGPPDTNSQVGRNSCLGAQGALSGQSQDTLRALSEPRTQRQSHTHTHTKTVTHIGGEEEEEEEEEEEKEEEEEEEE